MKNVTLGNCVYCAKPVLLTTDRFRKEIGPKKSRVYVHAGRCKEEFDKITFNPKRPND